MPTPGTGEHEQGTETPAGGSDAAKGEKDNTATIQAAIDAVVRRERTAADARARELETQLADVRTQLAEATKGKSGEGAPEVPAEYVESLRKPLVDENATLKERLAARDNAAKRSELMRIAQEFAVDGAAEDVASALLPNVRLLDTGGYEVVDKDGRAEYGTSGPKTLNEKVLEYLKSKPYFAKASVRSGAGFSDAPRNTPSSEGDVAEIKRQIAAHEAKQEFGKAAPLKQQLLDLQRKR